MEERRHRLRTRLRAQHHSDPLSPFLEGGITLCVIVLAILGLLWFVG